MLHEGAESVAFEHKIVADLRLATARYPDDPELTAMVHDLTARSPRFAELWEQFEVGPREDGRKTIHHPDIGPITLDCAVLAVADSDLRMVVSPPNPIPPTPPTSISSASSACSDSPTDSRTKLACNRFHIATATWCAPGGAAV